MDDLRADPDKTDVHGSARLAAFSQVGPPCRDLDEGKRFYVNVLGGELELSVPTFAYIRICGVLVGIGTDGCSSMTPDSEYPHIAFFVGPDELLHMKRWLAREAMADR